MKNVALLSGVLIILGGVGWYLFSTVPVVEAPVDAVNDQDSDPTSLTPQFEKIVDSYEDCVAAGNPVMESYPPRCRHDGVLYTAEVADSAPTPVPTPSPTPAPRPTPMPGDSEPVACTMDAKMCPDGSAVGRVGPDCEFAACPGESETDGGHSVMCTPESKQAQFCTQQYAPVCGLVQVQCVTTPCPPIPETFSNSCHACAQGNVESYTAGVCE